MKTMAQIKHFSQIMALLLAVVVSLSACGGTPTASNNSSDDSSTTTSTESGESSSSKTDGSGVQTSDQSGVSNPITSSEIDAAKKNGVFPKDPYAAMSDALKKKDVHVLMWRKYTKTEQALVNAYTKRTGVKINTTVTTETDYPTKLVSLISGKNSPDALCVSSGNFPGFITKSMQPLDVQTFRLNDKIWNKTFMDNYKVNGKYFSVAISGTWSCEDCAYVTYYNPYTLKDCGITTMPYDLYKQGKWDWDAQRKIAQTVVAKKSTYTGISFQDYDLLMKSAGSDFVKYDGHTFTNTLGKVKDGDLLVKAWTEMSNLNADRLISGYDVKKAEAGQVGLFSAIAYGLYNEGKWFDAVKTPGAAKGLQAVPLAGPKGGTAYTPIRPKTWGVAKGAKNVEGAAYFLRYFLDPSNANMSSTFYNAQFQEVFNKITSKSVPKSVKVGSGVVDYVNANSYSTLLGQLANTTAPNITSVLNQKKTVVDTGIKRANSDVKKIK